MTFVVCELVIGSSVCVNVLCTHGHACMFVHLCDVFVFFVFFLQCNVSLTMCPVCAVVQQFSGIINQTV